MEMKKIIFGVLGLTLALSYTSCKKDVYEEQTPAPFGNSKPVNAGPALDTLIGDITTSVTISRNAYLKGIVYVRPGVTLTINPGVTIYGSNGVTTVSPDLSVNKGTLVVEKGAKLIAVGTADQPIVWTSENPVGSRAIGDWGGIVLIGDAPISASVGGVCSGTRTFEGFDDPGFPFPTRNVYGGNNPADNSGSIVYNRIEFCGGAVLKADQEVNGLTLCAVGSGTTLLAIEVANCGDDSYEFFGGRVDAKGLISFNTTDDDFDFDDGYQGRLQFLIAYRTGRADVSGSRFIESDGNAAGLSCTNRTRPFISNASLISTGPVSGPNASGAFFDTASVLIRRRSTAILANSIVQRDPSFKRFVVGAPNSGNLIASATTLSIDSTYIGVNTVDNIVSSLSSDNNGRIATANLFLPLQGPSTPITNIFTVAGTGFNLNGVDPFFIATTDQGAVPTFLNWVTGAWVSTATN